METLPLPTIPCLASRNAKKYTKVNETVRTEFLRLIVHHNMSIKQASLELNINYSSAKGILAAHRKQQHGPSAVPATTPATYIQTAPGSARRVGVVTMIGGLEVQYQLGWSQPEGQLCPLGQPVRISIPSPTVLLKSPEGDYMDNTSQSRSE